MMGDRNYHRPNYFLFALLVIRSMRKQLSPAVGMHIIGFIMGGSYKIALYPVRLSAIYSEILLFPVRVRHIENARPWLPKLFGLYTPLWWITVKAIIFVNVMCVFHSHSRLYSGKIRFYDLQKFIKNCIEKLEVDIMMPSLVSEAQFIVSDYGTQTTVIFCW